MSLLDDFENRYVKPRRGATLIIGSLVVPGKVDRRLRYSNAHGVDMRPGPGVDEVLDMEEERPILGVFDHVECLSTLEHSRRPWLLAANIERVLKTGGTLFLTVPFVFRVHAYPDDYWRFTISGVKALFPKIEWAKLMFAHTTLSDKTTSIILHEPFAKTTNIAQGGLRYFPKTEVMGFGTRK